MGAYVFPISAWFPVAMVALICERISAIISSTRRKLDCPPHGGG